MIAMVTSTSIRVNPRRGVAVAASNRELLCKARAGVCAALGGETMVTCGMGEPEARVDSIECCDGD